MQDIHEPPCKFEVSKEATTHNWNMLARNKFDLELITNKHPRSVMSIGSEFKNTHDLQKLLGRHPRWGKVRTILEKGVNFELEIMDENLRHKDLVAAYERGDHKSASKNELFLSEAMSKEIKQEWSLILPESKY